MYPASSSSSSHHSIGSVNNLLRYGSAPSSFLTATVNSVVGIGSNGCVVVPSPATNHRFSVFHDSSFSDGARLISSDNETATAGGGGGGGSGTLERSYSSGSFSGMSTAVSDWSFADFGSAAAGSCSSSPINPPPSALIRHSSSPAGLLNRLASDIGFSVTKSTCNGHKASRLSSQLSFTKADSLSQISEADESAIDGISSKRGSNSSMAGFSLGSWDNSNSIMFNAPTTKRAKHINGDISGDLTTIESQYSLQHTALDLARTEHLIHIPEDSVPCKIRAKRGFATHPRSIAERERRTRISGKLKKLQDLVPNMDKQTSYSDMLDLAVQHIKGLQTQIQQLDKELQHCKCGCKQIINQR
ncbi:hypothetical protein Dimus_007493 [Dionaea muscipula]